jgi:hypothetical protein
MNKHEWESGEPIRRIRQTSGASSTTAGLVPEGGESLPDRIAVVDDHAAKLDPGVGMKSVAAIDS